MPSLSTANSRAPAEGRWFYSAATLALLVITLAGFRFFYLEGKAYPGRELAPPIRTLLVAHGILMTGWMALAAAQPLLVAAGRKRWHMAAGRAGALLALGLVVVGVQTGIGAARVAPPDLRLFGMSPKEFLVVPLGSIMMFGALVCAGVAARRRPAAHRPLMFMASLAAVSAALGRIGPLNTWYAGTWLERGFSAFLTMLLLGALVLGVKWGVTRRFDGWFASVLAALAVCSMALSLGSKTGAWDSFATFLLR